MESNLNFFICFFFFFLIRFKCMPKQACSPLSRECVSLEYDFPPSIESLWFSAIIEPLPPVRVHGTRTRQQSTPALGLSHLETRIQLFVVRTVID